MARRSNPRATVAAAVGFGVAHLRPDPAFPRAWTLLVDGVPQSYVDLADPAHLRSDYLERLAAVLRSCAPPRVPRRALRPGGLMAMNVADVPPLSWTRVRVATLGSVFAGVCLLADAAFPRGRRAGNAVLVAGDDLGALPGRLSAVHGPELAAFTGGAGPCLDEPG